MPNGKGKDSKGTFKGIDGKPSLFHYATSREAGIAKFLLPTISLSSHLGL
jgi:hypothetical protein